MVDLGLTNVGDVNIVASVADAVQERGRFKNNFSNMFSVFIT